MKANTQAATRRLLRLNAAAAYLSISTWTLRRIVQGGELPVIKYGEHVPWLIDVKDLDGWIERTKATL